MDAFLSVRVRRFLEQSFYKFGMYVAVPAPLRTF
jgi:hypothetical protein